MNLTLEIAAGLFEPIPTIAGYLSATDQQDSAAVGGYIIATGSAAATDEQDVVLSTGSIAPAQDNRLSGDAPTWTPRLSVVRGAGSATDSADGCTSRGNIRIVGTLAARESSDDIAIIARIEMYAKYKQRRNQQSVMAWLMAA